jgi:hypothetical protein
LHRRREGIVQRVFGEIEIAQQADERRKDAARLLAIDLVYQRTDLLTGRVRAHRCWDFMGGNP